MAVTVFSPAKINLYLSVTGCRDDGFHDLVSVAAPLDFGDELTATVIETDGESRFRLECDHPDVPVDDSNLVLKAAFTFAEATGWPALNGRSGVHFKLAKRIPIGAGLGGGSSNAVAALRALNILSS
jgi:4-diphosphocytidyl-2-C-methyl-D-erythritol kinase